MIDIATIEDIFVTYKKYGWLLRRVLLTEELKNTLTDDNVFNGAEVRPSDIDAAWFSRTPADYPIAWELRHLSETPYALLETLNENESDFEEKLSDIEQRLREAVAKKPSP